MLLDAFGFPLKVKKPDDQLIKAFVRLRRTVKSVDNNADRGEVSRVDKDMDEKEGEADKQNSQSRSLAIYF